MLDGNQSIGGRRNAIVAERILHVEDLIVRNAVSFGVDQERRLKRKLRRRLYQLGWGKAFLLRQIGCSGVVLNDSGEIDRRSVEFRAPIGKKIGPGETTHHIGPVICRPEWPDAS